MDNQLPIVKADPWLEPHAGEIEYRLNRYHDTLQRIKDHYGSFEQFSSAHHYLGINYDAGRKGWYYREWAPGAHGLFLIGDFNNWDRESHPLQKDERGVWEIFLDEDSYQNSFKHGSLVKVLIHSSIGSHERIPAYIRRAVQDPVSYDFSGQVWMPPKPYKWKKTNFNLSKIKEPLIYECHIGMAQEKEGIGSYEEFTNNVLPRIQEAGYNVIQIMAIHEHPYYGSFGYHVSNFFAPSSKFGTPEELKKLIDTAHGMGIAVVMDVVHSHAVKNIYEGLSEFDGTDHLYFHGGERGNHSGWDSKLFNYGKWEVLQFLLSNLRYWMEEFNFDGFRFDGVTSMLYHHHGYTSFDHYGKYFNDEVDRDAVLYLQMANMLIHSIKPDALSIAEDVSGMPGLCRPVEEGGIGFDYRLSMGIPDYWIKLLNDRTDEQWDIHEMWNMLNHRRRHEKSIAYAESHDQALVGDKTIAFRLMDKEMYWHMSVNDDNIVIDRGIALHKLIRLFTIALGGEGYMNFIGNEFGHPEWVDFPREGNKWSYKYARRMWSLVDNDQLKYHYLAAFDKAMIEVIKKHSILSADPAAQLNMDEANKVIIFERNNLIFLFNFHTSHSIPDYRFWVPKKGKYKVVLNSDATEMGGHGRIDDSLEYETDDRSFMSIYLTNRTALVLERRRAGRPKVNE
jgi:1,4-alpha-glucan branching enzyme